VAALKKELDKDPAEPERRRKQRTLQAAEERAQRIEPAHQKLTELMQEQSERAETQSKEAEKGEPKVSVSDPEARLMRLADSATAPAWNVQSLPRRRPGWPLPMALSSGRSGRSPQ
jgi:hypothetical protein